MALTVDDTTIPAPVFQWGANGARMTPEQIAAQRKVADALMEKAGDYSPIRSWTQGAARLAQGIVSGLDYREAAKADQANSDDNKAMIAALLSGKGAAPTQSPAASVATDGTVPAAVVAAPTAPAVDTTNKIYSNDEPSPMDPPSGQDRINMVATALGEEKPGSPESLGVINTIRNRAVDGGYGGDTPTAVVTAPKQYSPWNDASGRSRMANAMQNPDAVAKVNDAIDQAYGVGKYVAVGPNDNTAGKTHFYDPASMVPVNSVPKWAQGRQGQQIGNTQFFDDPDDAPGAKPVQVASNDPAAIPAAATPTQGYAAKVSLPSLPLPPLRLQPWPKSRVP
jgi:hypothetical protein